MSATKKKNSADFFRISVTLKKSHFLAVKQEANKSYGTCSQVIAKLVQDWFEKEKKE